MTDRPPGDWSDIVSRFIRAQVRCLITFAVWWVFWSLYAAPAAAQDEREKRLPVLGDRAFIVSAEVQDPSVTSFLRSATGGGLAFDIATPVLDADSNIVVYEGNLAFLELGLEAQAAVTDWLAVRLAFDGGARVGTSFEALSGSGVSAVYGYLVGAMVRLLETRKVLLSATADFTGNRIHDVSYLKVLRQALREGVITLDPVESGTDRALAGGLRFGWAASRLIGVRLSGAVGVADPFREELDSKVGYYAGAGVGFNLANTSSVPIGFLGFFKIANFNPGSSDIVGASFRTGLEIDYTGKSDFSTGVTLAYNRLETALTGQPIDTFDAVINLRYYF